MFLSTLLSQHVMAKVPTETVLIAVILFASVTTFTNASDSNWCRPYTPDPDPDVGDNKVPPLLFMGWTWDKMYYVTPRNISSEFDFFEAAFSYCPRFGMRIASIRTLCEFEIVDNWFKVNYPTDYSLWIAGIRFGQYGGPEWLSGGPIDMSDYGYTIDYVGGPYPPGGYDPIPYPWANFLTCTRNCAEYTGGPTNPCTQTPTYPETNFYWADGRVENGVICERPIYYSKKKDDNDEGVYDEDRNDKYDKNIVDDDRDDRDEKENNDDDKDKKEDDDK